MPEDAPQQPRTRKRRIRVEMEAMLHAASVRGLRTLIVRAGDFLARGRAAQCFRQAAKINAG
ncbi:MAG: hypothetical protein ACRYG8_30845 [Janthinobacterium lividum]